MIAEYTCGYAGSKRQRMIQTTPWPGSMITIIAPCPYEAFGTLEIDGNVERPYVAREVTTAKVTTVPLSQGQRLYPLLSLNKRLLPDSFASSHSRSSFQHNQKRVWRKAFQLVTPDEQPQQKVSRSMVPAFVLPAPQIAHEARGSFPKKNSQNPLIIILNPVSGPEFSYDLGSHQRIFKLSEH